MEGVRKSVPVPSERPRKESERVCVLCCGDTEIVAVGECDHAVCWKCSTRMRVLCQQNYCAVCRKDLDKVVFTTKRQPFSSVSTDHLRVDRKYGIYFMENFTQKRYRELLEHKCSDCPEKPTFRTFPQLTKHMRKLHELFYCDLCSEHLQIFSWERKTYTRKALAEHRRMGDKDDKSYRGHPLCEFCDERYMDNDSLLKHLRKDHYYCHVCDAGGSNQYYSDYEVLRAHFRDAHFLCEEDECREEKFTSVFSTMIDLKAHQASVHSKKLSKAQARQARQLDMNFQLVPRPGAYAGRGRGGVVSREDYDDVGSNNRPGTRRNKKGLVQEREEAVLTAALKASLQYKTPTEEDAEEERPAATFDRPEDFPSLLEGATNQESSQTNQAGAPSAQQSMAMRVGFSYRRSVKNGTLNEEDFPQLGVDQKKTVPVVPVAGRWTEEPTTGMSAKQLAKDFPPLQTLKKQSYPVRSVLPEKGRKVGGAPSGDVNQNRSKTAPKYTSQEDYRQPDEYPASTANNLPWSKVQLVQGQEKVNKPVVSQARPRPEDFPALTPVQTVPQWTKKQGQAKTQSGSKWASLTTEESVDKKKSSVPDKTKAEKNVSEGAAKKKKKKRKKKTGGGSGEEEEKVKPENTTEGAKCSKQVVSTTVALVTEDGDGLKSNPTEPTSLIPDDSTQGGIEKEVHIEVPSLSEEDFPSLGGDVPSAYFAATLPEEISPLCSGLGKTSSPPPGLSQLADSLVNVSVIPKAPPGFQTYTNPDPLPPPPLPLPQVDPGPYIQPDNFQQRNHQLTSSIMACLTKDNKISQFKDLSRRFRQGALPASEYYTICRKLFQESFSKIFVELLVLLPDTHKQQELWQTVTAGVEQRGCDISTQCLACPTCLQIVKNNDFSSHTQQHSLDKDFPTLSSVLLPPGAPPGLIQDFPSLGEPFGTQKTSVWKKM